MYAVVARVQFRSAATKAQVQQVERELVEPLSQQPGFRAYCGMRVSDTEALAIHVWDSQADAEQAIQFIGPGQQPVVPVHHWNITGAFVANGAAERRARRPVWWSCEESNPRGRGPVGAQLERAASRRNPSALSASLPQYPIVPNGARVLLP